MPFVLRFEALDYACHVTSIDRLFILKLTGIFIVSTFMWVLIPLHSLWGCRTVTLSTHFWPLFTFHTNCKCQETKDFLVFLGVIKWRSSHRRSSIKNMFLKFSQYSQKNTCVGDFLIKLQLFCERLLPKIRTLARSRLEGDFITGVLLRIIKLHENRDSNTGVFLREIIQCSFFIEHKWSERLLLSRLFNY